jgi:osmoprotectant transport system ATP-binding protein
METANVVELERVSKAYGGEKVVDGLSLSVKEGEIFVLIGPSGCGKTTTLKMINQLIRQTEGCIRVKGADVRELDPVELRRSIGYVIQYVGLLPHLTIQDNITFVLQLKRSPKRAMQERARELIETVGLPQSYLERYPRELSGGQQQRIGVARALAADPDILLMDEPFGAIDPITRGQLQNELLRLQASIKKTIVFVTHDMQEAFKLGTKIAIMRKGAISACGNAMEIVKSTDEFVLSFIGRGAIFDALNAVPVARVMRLDVPRVPLGASVPPRADAWESAFVIGPDGRCLGTVPFDDGGAADEARIIPLGAGCDRGLSLRAAIEEMLWTGRTWLPVLSDSGGLEGVVSFKDCADRMIRRMEEP